MTPVERLREAVMRAGGLSDAMASLLTDVQVAAVLAAIDCAEREKYMGHDAARAYCAALARLEEK